MCLLLVATFSNLIVAFVLTPLGREFCGEKTAHEQHKTIINLISACRQHAACRDGEGPRRQRLVQLSLDTIVSAPWDYFQARTAPTPIKLKGLL